MAEQNQNKENSQNDTGNSEEASNSHWNQNPTGFLHEQSWADRNGFPHWLLAFIWVVVSFLLFQLVGTLVMVGYLFAISDEPVTGFDPQMIIEHLDVMFIGNSLSQILFLGLATWIITGLSTSDSRAKFLRFRADHRTLPVILQTALLIVVFQPIIWLLSWINMQIPFPEGYAAFEDSQMELIKDFLTGDHLVMLTIIHVGLVPSVCEEILYRGYVLRALEKSWGIWAAIVVSGLLFGLYHVRLTQVIPLAIIGILLAWVVWRSDSIFPAMAGHFVNNGGSVLLASIYPDYAMEQMATSELPSVWLLLISIGGAFMLLRYIHQTTRQE